MTWYDMLVWESNGIPIKYAFLVNRIICLQGFAHFLTRLEEKGWKNMKVVSIGLACSDSGCSCSMILLMDIWEIKHCKSSDINVGQNLYHVNWL